MQCYMYVSLQHCIYVHGALIRSQRNAIISKLVVRSLFPSQNRRESRITIQSRPIECLLVAFGMFLSIRIEFEWIELMDPARTRSV